jgi:aspartate/methionine/tyrosine aminotransferase
MPPFSQRSQRDFTPNAYAKALAAARAKGVPLLDLSSGNPTEQGLGFSSEALAAVLEHPELAVYTPAPFGLYSARASVSDDLRRYGLSVAPEHIMLTASTSEAYAMLFKLLCDPGDAVLVPQPSYPLLEVLAALENVTLIPYALSYDGEWHIDPEALRAANATALGRARAIVTVHPNNPTGSFLKRHELSLLSALNLPIISDEVFSDYALDNSRKHVASALIGAQHNLVFRLSGLSKSLLLPQLKLAFTAVAGPAEMVRAACARLEHIADAFLSPSNVAQLALPRLLHDRELVQRNVLARVRENRDLLVQRLSGSAASVLRIEGGWYAIVALPAVKSDEEWCLTLLAQQKLVLQPGYFFDLQGTHVVLSLITREAAFADGILRLRATCDAVCAA